MAKYRKRPIEVEGPLTEYQRIEKEGREGLARCDASYERVRQSIVKKNAAELHAIIVREATYQAVEG